ncbi:MAG: hypothetical protein Tsb0014_39430 [Pleurocapsa sp.]
METSLEVRWFISGIPPALTKRWFRSESPGKSLEDEPETREDLYACRTPEEIAKFSAIAVDTTSKIAINLKLRERSLELKLRRRKLGQQRFGNLQNSAVWLGNVEQWNKFTERELIDFGFSISNLIPETNWIPVSKKREQKVERGVKSELTWLRINGSRWWSIAFEMTQDSNDAQQDNYFTTVINRYCQNYYGPELSAKNSYSYSRWLLEISSNK